METENCGHCGRDIVQHHAGNLKCPDRPTVYRKVFIQSFDARDWAREFVGLAKLIPDLPADEGVMTSWFANALMRGFDEHYWRSKEYKRQVRRVLVPWWKRWLVPLNSFGACAPTQIIRPAQTSSHMVGTASSGT